MDGKTQPTGSTFEAQDVPTGSGTQQRAAMPGMAQAQTVPPSGPARETESTSKAAEHSAWETLDKWPPAPSREDKLPGPLDVYEQSEWAQALDHYNKCDKTQLPHEFEDQVRVFFELHKKNAVPAMEAGIDLQKIIESLSRRYYRIKHIFDLIVPNEEQMENFSHIQHLMDEIRGEQMAFEEVMGSETGNGGEGYAAARPTMESTKVTMDDMIIQAVLHALEEYVAQPDDPKWARLAKDMDEGKPVTRDVAIRRYLIDLARIRVFSKENADCWGKLVTETGLEAFQVMLDIWTSRFPEEE